MQVPFHRNCLADEEKPQSIEPSPAVPGDDAGTRRAKAELEPVKARQESQRQLQRLESERPAR